MRISKQITIVLLMVLIATACHTEKEKNSLEGLWLVESVELDHHFETPISRWMKFNSDGTQTSGNGWLQHSEGSWTIENNLIVVKNTNGIEDDSQPFKVSFEKEQMIWQRTEQDGEVTVRLKRIKKLPTSEGNKLFGLWKLTRSTNDGNDITVMSNPSSKAMLHLRWDNTYVQHYMPKGKSYGVYKIHGHKPEIQLVNYGNESKFSFWSFTISDKKLTLISTDKTATMEFERIHQFIQ